ncbi:nuclear transport factor 2 family protein [Pseudomaricurvus alkylphenolicus]|uniref:DUF4440 domain-containing protein n=1 Tax=Pseudomaricurvus alkylphenolicus TaxID=1306991 RepID=UPI0014201D29|nr:DUF4440 domain-containing protein [Pseudomaricurvus alkylphenolicus]NIB40153.1 nuclear transport factor 2 family protein [Pseudomaricurvus alkylphenolicus]
MEDLKAVRKKWIETYFAGDIEALKTMEFPNYMVLSELGLEDQEERLSSIANKIATGVWFPPGAEKQETDVSYLGNDCACQVIGSGTIVVGDQVIRRFNFSEFWLKDGDQWKAQCLHLSHKQ